MKPYILANAVRPYAWGSRDFIAALQGRPAPSATPEAELWMGAHPGGPSELEDGGRRLTLAERIAADPVAMLGQRVAARFSGRLPFLMKVLAAAQPLSLQVHPDRAQAAAGFEAEDRAGIPLSAPHRSYKDREHKPELIVALTPFVALCGFRPVAMTQRLLLHLAVPELAPLVTLLEQAPPGRALQEIFGRLLTADDAARRGLADATLRAATRVSAEAPLAAECEWVIRLAALYPGDIGIVCALFLNLVHLRPTEALYLPAGNLHAYLDGAGVEIMASSDNVLRGGLTPKWVDVPELLKILRFEELAPAILHPRTTTTSASGREELYETPAEEFELACLHVGGGSTAASAVGVGARVEVEAVAPHRPNGPEIGLVTEGSCRLELPSGSVHLSRGESVFIPAELPAYTVTGQGTMFRASVPVGPARP